MPEERPRNCSTCRYHSKEMREPPVEVALDTVVEFNDPQPFYICRAPAGPKKDQEVGFEPVLCDQYKPTRQQAAALEEADALLARFNERHQPEAAGLDESEE